jgi:quercetin dioxygenase-like cupin family protein
MKYAAVAGILLIVPLAAQDQRPQLTAVWAPKPTATPAYPPGHRPWVTLAEIKARHRGTESWRERVVDDGRLAGEYEAAAPGTRLDRRFHPDTREWFAVVEGEVRVDIEGQAPFTATRGSIVNIPRQTMYALETIGEKPSLRFSVNVARAKTLFARDLQSPTRPATPPPPGMGWMPAVVNRNPTPYDQFNQPHVNIHEAAAKNEQYSGGRFVRDDKSELLIIYGYEKNLPPLDPADKGHFHPESAEFWLVFAGQIRYRFEGQQPFVASEGDVVYVPAGTWHATRFTGDSAACRLSITEYVGNTLLLEPRR